jgi:hypothetical protein
VSFLYREIYEQRAYTQHGVSRSGGPGRATGGQARRQRRQGGLSAAARAGKGRGAARAQVAIRAGDTVLDVGANIGLFSRFAAQVRAPPARPLPGLLPGLLPVARPGLLGGRAPDAALRAPCCCRRRAPAGGWWP